MNPDIRLIRKRSCRFCQDEEARIDYKDVKLLSRYVSEVGKIVPGRITGTCSKHQRKLNHAIKNARILALLPFATNHTA